LQIDDNIVTQLPRDFRGAVALDRQRCEYYSQIGKQWVITLWMAEAPWRFCWSNLRSRRWSAWDHGEVFIRKINHSRTPVGSWAARVIVIHLLNTISALLYDCKWPEILSNIIIGRVISILAREVRTDPLPTWNSWSALLHSLHEPRYFL